MTLRWFLVSLPVALATGCGIPGFDLFGPSNEDECRFDSDCGDDEECDRGECVELDEGNEGEGEGDPGEGEGEGDPPPDPQGPRFLQLSTNITTMDSSDSLIITAVLTDDDGVDDIIGGSLVDPDNAASYGAFQTSASEGSYQITLGWSALNSVRPIDFGTTGTRRLLARLFDVAGDEAAQSVTITLTCNGEPACNGYCGAARCSDNTCTSSEGTPDGAQWGICGSTCRDLATATDCGGCNASCSGTCTVVDGSYVACVCEAGDCGTGTACVDQQCQTTTDLSLQALSTDTPNDGLAMMQIAGYEYSLCDFTASEADLFCTAVGYSEGSLSALPSYSGYSGYSVNCTGASVFLDCEFTYDSSCDVSRVVHCGPPDVTPPGDFACVDGGDLGSSSVSTTGSTSGLSNNRSACAGSGPERSYRWHAPTTGSYIFHTYPSTLDTVLTVLDGDCDAAALGCDDDGYGAGDSYLLLSVVAGHDYVVIVDSKTTTGNSFALGISAY